MKRDLISMLDVQDDILDLLDLAEALKNGSAEEPQPLKGKTLAMIFEKSSTRTRVSFEVGITQLGGHAVNLNPKDMQMGRGETVADTAKVLSRYVDGIMYRAFDNRMMKELAMYASVPVINGLDDIEHPCQILADLLTIRERFGRLNGLKMAYVGDGNNVCNSMLLGCAMVGMDLICACPKGYWPDATIAGKAKEIASKSGCTSLVVEDPYQAAKCADVIYTDVWVSMGQEKEAKEKERIFLPYQINEELMAVSKAHRIIMHCLPAHRGMEITDDVIDGEHSVVFDQAENRLHAQKAVMAKLMA